MSYTFNRSESLRAGTRRIAREQIASVVENLENSEADYDESIHSSRKSLKKIRAILFLLKYELKEDFRKENIFYRDTGRKLSGVRDLAVMQNTLGKLKEISNSDLSEEIEEACNIINQEYSQFKNKINRKEIVTAGVVRDLKIASENIDKWQINSTSFNVIKEGLHKIFERGKLKMSEAKENPLSENFHEWRKSAKYLWYSVRLLQKSWSNVLKEYSSSLEELTESLGEIQDLSQLRKYLIKLNLERNIKIENLLELIAKKKTELQNKSFNLGEKIYSESPDSFTNRMEVYYKTWSRRKPKKILVRESKS